MDYLIKISFMDDKELVLIYEKEKLDAFIECLNSNKAFFDDKTNSAVCIPLYNVRFYNYFEYTAEMKKKNEEKKKAMEEAKIKAMKEAQETKEETK